MEEKNFNKAGAIGGAVGAFLAVKSGNVIVGSFIGAGI